MDNNQADRHSMNTHKGPGDVTRESCDTRKVKKRSRSRSASLVTRKTSKGRRSVAEASSVTRRTSEGRRSVTEMYDTDTSRGDKGTRMGCGLPPFSSQPPRGSTTMVRGYGGRNQLWVKRKGGKIHRFHTSSAASPDLPAAAAN